MILDWKNDSDDKLVNLVCRLVHEDERFSSAVKKNLAAFFQFTLVSNPEARSDDLEHLLSLLVANRSVLIC